MYRLLFLFLFTLIGSLAPARFTAVDPAREFYNPYAYAGNNPTIFVDLNGKNAYLFVWLTKGGKIGHASIAVDLHNGGNEVQVFGRWPLGSIGMKTLNKDVSAFFENYTISNNAIQTYRGGKPHSADGILMFQTSKAFDEELLTLLNEAANDPNAIYNALSANCSNFVCDALNEAGIEVSGMEVLAPKSAEYEIDNAGNLMWVTPLPAFNIVTPNQLYKDASALPNTTVLKNPGSIPSTAEGITNGFPEKAPKIRNK